MEIPINDTGNKIEDFLDIHKGETCFILGNGPSLNEVDLRNLPYKTFGSNRVYLSGFHPDYYSCVNPLVLEQFGDEIRQMKSVKFLNPEWAQRLGGIPIDTHLDVPVFGMPNHSIWEGHTVTYVLLQLAFYMGFKKAILIGVDHDYGDKGLRPNLELVATGADAWHFHPDYFGKGVRWNAPDLARSELAYSLAKRAWENNGRKIVNASARTKLTVFPLESYRRAVYGGPRVSAIVSAYKCPKEWIEETIEDLRYQSEEVEIVIVHQRGDENDIPPGADVYVPTPDVPTVYRAWNLGIKNARGEYITNCNTDDRRHPLSIETMANVLDARPEVDVVYHDQFITWNVPKTFEKFLLELQEEPVAGRYEGKPGVFIWHGHSLEALGQGCYLGPQPMWRASLHQRYGYFLENYRSAGDYEFWLRVAKEDNFFHINAILGVYCARMEGIELSDPTTNLNESTQALRMNQDPNGVTYRTMGDIISIEIGGKRVFADVRQFFRTMDDLRKNYAGI